jgi:SAM-dependent methyltransferase
MYRQIARYYDLVHQELRADIGFILTMAGQAAAAPDAGPVLELGCGSGRLLLPLARAGRTVVGLDSEPAMLDQARRRLDAEPPQVRQRVTLVAGDMTDFDLPERFSLALAGYNTFMHLDWPAMQKSLSHIARHLQPAGRLVLDLANPTACAQTPDDRMLTLERVLLDPESGMQVLQLASSWVDLEAQTLHVTWIFDASPPEGGPVHRTVAQARYHYLYPHELELLLGAAGLRLEALYGGYTQVPFEEESERMIVVARPG